MTPQRNTFPRGFTTVMMLHILQIVFLKFLSLFLVGLTQLGYVIPVAWIAHKRHETPRLQGILSAAAITILVNGIGYFAILHEGLEAIP